MAVNNVFMRSISLIKKSANFCQGIKQLRHLSSSRIVRSNTDYGYIDITKQNKVIVGMQQLRKLMGDHVGGKNDNIINIIKSQDELEARCMQDSIQEVIIPFGSDAYLHDDYVNFYGGIRVGKLLQDLDTLSVWCGFKYYKDLSQHPPFSLVTAFVDTIDFSESQSLNAKQDLKFKGFVSWVGTTSLEVTIIIEQQETSGEWKKKAESIFIMAARSVVNGHSAILNKMIPQDDVEEWYFNRGESCKLARKNQKSESLFATAPTADEREIIHDKFLKTINLERATFQSRIKPDNTVWMEDTRLKNLVICHPESRNIYNKIFGGYLMKEAFELAWANACIYMKCNPIIVCVEDIIFRRPVEIGSLLYLSSIIVYTSERHVQIRVVAEVYDPKAESFSATNTFYFCFSADKSIPQVIPKTYGEYILYLDGRRVCANHLRID